MKFNKWTVALAALGVVSLASAAKAEEKASPVMTALASTTISGYVDTSAEWNFGTGNANPAPYKFNSPSKADGFNLDVIQLRIDKPLDESDWAAGYRADLWFGPDANILGTQSVLATGASDFAIRQAYVALRAPVGSGLDFKMGVFDSVVGYESIEAGNNPNFTRSYGHSIEPQTHTGLLASYRFCDAFSASAGVADTTDSSINSRAQMGSTGVVGGPFAPLWNNLTGNAPGNVNSPTVGDNAKAESYKTYMGSIALTAPESMGFLSGSTLYAGIVNGYNNSILGSGLGDNQTSYYIGATVATPVTGLRLGAAFDFLDLQRANGTTVGDNALTIDGHASSVAGYASFQATEKLSLHGRIEYAETKLDGSFDGTTFSGKEKILALTGTVQYDLWKNVISRVELRWDHSANGSELFGGTVQGEPNRINAFMLAANVIYKF
jgi:hypothetical protein